MAQCLFAIHGCYDLKSCLRKHTLVQDLDHPVIFNQKHFFHLLPPIRKIVLRGDGALPLNQEIGRR
jgi:hypothetical protein